jgi:predicted metal-dependent phosphoesterase TrpH
MGIVVEGRDPQDQRERNEFEHAWAALMVDVVGMTTEEGTQILSFLITEEHKREAATDPLIEDLRILRRQRLERLTPWHRMMDSARHKWQKRKRQTNAKSVIDHICRGRVLQAKMDHTSRMASAIRQQRAADHQQVWQEAVQQSHRSS